MSRVNSLSVLICTYNRSALLGQTLGTLQTAYPPDRCTVEVIVVDNNSTDDTREVVRQAAATGPYSVRYLAERQQGKSFALNS